MRANRVAGRFSRPVPHTTPACGSAPGEVFTHQGKYLIGGLVNGNIFIGMQPPRGFLDKADQEVEQDGSLLHDPDIPPTHHYPAYYRWIRETFGAQAVFHIGKHGTQEWLPGKSLGLSENCFPDVALQDLPNLYPYIVNNPGEGTQAKRRGHCCILDHMIPPQTSAGRYGPLQELNRLLDAYWQARTEDPNKLPLLAEKVWSAAEAAHLDKDLEISRDAALADPGAFMQRLHGYLNEVANTCISDGLHVFGAPPAGGRLLETLVQLTRLPCAGMDSLWEAIAEEMGLEYEDLRDNPGEFLQNHGRTKGQLMEDIAARAQALIDALDGKDGAESSVSMALEEKPAASGRVTRVLEFIRADLRPRLMRVTDEMTNAVRGINGEFVPPGAAGCPTRGSLEVLPTGRNFYSVDPFKIPSPEAWEVGKRLGKDLVDRYVKDTGKVPEQIGMIIWASPTMRTRGDDFAEILYLMGLKPAWQTDGRVAGLEVIPLEELAFPRIDVTIRTSGLFRDAFPNLQELLDTGVRMVAALKEPAHMNFLARNVTADARELRASGVSEAEARRRASFRVFSDKPGAYGAGIDVLLESGKWQETEDLGRAYVSWGGYAYGKEAYGQHAPDLFRRRMAKVDLTVKNEDAREHDILSSDDYNAYFGGMNAAVKFAAGAYPRSYSGDASDPRRPRTRATDEEGRFVFRARILNPKWIEGLKRHGYKGAGDLSRVVDICFQWDASSKILQDWQYEQLAETYALDPAMREFFQRHNPDALRNITERLLEAIRREMWEDPGAYRDKLEEAFLQAEGDVEDRLQVGALSKS